MKNKFRLIYVLVFFIICILPSILLPIGFRNSEIEKKELSDVPKLFKEGSLNNNFSADCESWLNDYLPFRNVLLSSANFIKGGIMHTQTSNVISGKDGWLFFEDTKADYMNTNAMSDAQLSEIAVTLSLIEESVEAENGHFLFMPMPDKSSVYGEFMPDCYEQADENNLTRLQSVLDEYDVSYLDMRKILTEKKSFGVYHKRDTHWNYLGAMFGYSAMMDALGKEHKEYSDTAYQPVKEWHGDLDKMLYPFGGVSDYQYEFDIDYEPFSFVIPSGVTDTASQLAVFMSDKEENDSRIATKKEQLFDGSRLYMVRDSFGRALLPFLIDNYDYTMFVRTDCPDLSMVNEGTDMVYEIAERNLSDLIHTAPFMPAPIRKNVEVSAQSSDEVKVHISEEGFGCHIYGAFPDNIKPENSRVYVRLTKETESVYMEAFPIKEASLSDENGEYGFSLWLNEGISDGTYHIEIIADGTAYPTQEDALITISKSAEDDETETNPQNNGTDAVQWVNGILADRVKVQYRQALFGVGDNIYDFRKSLGSEAAPSTSAASCLTGESILEFYYAGMNIQANEKGEIFSIELSNHLYAGSEGMLAGGIRYGSSIQDVKKALGTPQTEEQNQIVYEENGITAKLFFSDEKVDGIWITDENLK